MNEFVIEMECKKMIKALFSVSWWDSSQRHYASLASGCKVGTCFQKWGMRAVVVGGENTCFAIIIHNVPRLHQSTTEIKNEYK